ncbi:hypothetical protein SLS54_008301, partial [Diplodia seriata]
TWLKDEGGVIQVDLGKDTPQGFKRTGMLNRPPQVLLAAAEKLESNTQSRRIPELLEDLRRRRPNRAQELTCDYSNDKLYQASYEHPQHMATCESCDPSRLVRRPERFRNDPVIHYGLIASGNQVMKHAPNRERLKEELGILCFEMEGAGLMNDFPCIVIRGICDYSDSHKNKRWQLYAAVVAAAYAKELLENIEP